MTEPTAPLPNAPDAPDPTRAHKPPPATDRLFFALRPDAEAAARIPPVVAALRAAHRLRGTSLAPARWHVTVCFLGDHAGDLSPVLDAARAAADAVCGTPAFDVVFDRAASFASGRAAAKPLVLQGGEALGPLRFFQAALGAALQARGLAPERRPYVPHLTLLYDVQAIPPQPVAPIAWRADTFVLVRSRIGQGVHEVLGEWALAG